MVLQGCYAVDSSVFTDVSKDRGVFFSVRSFSPEGIAVLRIFVIWEDCLFTDMKSVVVDLITSLHSCVQDVQPKILFCSETLVLFSLKS